MKISSYQVQNIIRTFGKRFSSDQMSDEGSSILKPKKDVVSLSTLSPFGEVKESPAFGEDICKKIKGSVQKFKFCVIRDDMKVEVREFSPEKVDFTRVLQQKIGKGP